MIRQLNIGDFLKQRSTLPVVDVRSPAEFSEGHITGAINIALLNNEERAAVGTDYKRKGRQEAIQTGFRLMGPRLSEVVDKALQVSGGKELLVHCWRGGLRSSYFAQFAGMADISTRVLAGGYKAYRHRAMETFGEYLNLRVLSGSTGSGKTEVLQALQDLGEQAIELEALANHKGSVFGGLGKGPQPTTEQFQNDLFESILRLDRDRRVWIEDESVAIGRIFLPEPFWQQKIRSPVVVLDLDRDSRIERLVQEYGTSDQEEFVSAMEKIEKRLGGQHLNEARDMWRSGDARGTMDKLLVYYDKAYSNSLNAKREKILGRATWDGVSAGQAAGQAVSLVESTGVLS